MVTRMEFFKGNEGKKSGYQHIILHSVATKVVGICTSKQNYAEYIFKKHVRNKDSKN